MDEYNNYDINPATGSPMINSSSVDVGGNGYGSGTIQDMTNGFSDSKKEFADGGEGNFGLWVFLFLIIVNVSAWIYFFITYQKDEFMSSLNKVELIGRLGNDPELRAMPNGEAVTTLSVATSESQSDKISGEKKEKTEWHRIVFYGRLAEIAGQYLKKVDWFTSKVSFAIKNIPTNKILSVM